MSKPTPKLVYMSDEEFRYRITHAGRLSLDTLLVSKTYTVLIRTNTMLRLQLPL